MFACYSPSCSILYLDVSGGVIILGDTQMSDDKTQRGPQASSRIDMHEDHELAYVKPVEGELKSGRGIQP